MTEKILTIADKILDQLNSIEQINHLIEISEKIDSPIMIRQHEYLKKQYTKNLFKMLQESYQIQIPKVQKETV
ncbi:MAG: hypothetical protein AAGJ18_09655 [Bacteroidota bacterium]